MGDGRTPEACGEPVEPNPEIRDRVPQPCESIQVSEHIGTSTMADLSEKSKIGSMDPLGTDTAAGGPPAHSSQTWETPLENASHPDSLESIPLAGRMVVPAPSRFIRPSGSGPWSPLVFYFLLSFSICSGCLNVYLFLQARALGAELDRRIAPGKAIPVRK